MVEISVVMPVYNAENFLHHSIDSILNQSFADFELIIINDGSTDTSMEVIRSFKDARIRCITQENSGIGLALKLGCSLANGKYIARMDADDIAHEDRLEVQYKFMQRRPDVILVSTACNYIDSSGKSMGRSFPFTSFRAIKLILESAGSPICHPAVLMRSEAYERTSGYEDLQPLEDFYLWHQFIKLGKVINLPVPLIDYRVSDGSLSRSLAAVNYNYLRTFLIEMIRKNVDNDIVVEDFKVIYEKMPKDNVFLTEGKVSKFEHFLYALLTSLFLPESVAQNLVCSLKNQIIILKSLTGKRR